MKKIILLIDQFGYTPQFIVKKENQYHSIFGGITTILLYVIGFVAFCFFAQEIFLKKSPSVNLSTQNDEHPSAIQYENNFEFMIGIQNNQYKVVMNDTIFTAKGVLFKTIVNESGSYSDKIDLDLEPCSEALKNSTNYYLLEQYELDGYYCIARKQSKVGFSDLYVNEFWGNDKFQMIQIKIYDCQNSTTKQNCASQEEIDSFLGLTEMSVLMVDTLIQTRDYKNPFQRGIKEKFYYVSNKFQVSITEYIQHLEIISDDGLLFTTNESNDTFKIDSLIDYTIYQRDSKTMVSFSVQLNNIKEMYYRKYYKLQDLAAQVGGIFKTLLMIFTILTQFYSEHSYYEYLINHFFEIKFKKEDFQPTSLKKTCLKNTKRKFFDTTKKDNINNQRTLSQHNLQTKNEEVKQKNKKCHKNLKLSFFDKVFFLTFIPKLSKARKNYLDKIYFFGRDKLSDYLEIGNVLNIFHNQETVITILFSEEQKKLSDYAFKPLLTPTSASTRYSRDDVLSKLKEKIIRDNFLTNNKKIDTDGKKSFNERKKHNNNSNNRKQTNDNIKGEEKYNEYRNESDNNTEI